MQIIRRIDTRIPTPLLSTFMTPTATAPLGKLMDYRTSVKATQSSSASSPSWRPTAAVSPATAATATASSKSWNTTTQTQPTQRGWTSVVAASSSSSSSSGSANTQSTHHQSSAVFAPKPTTSSVSASDSSTTLGVERGSSLSSRTASPAVAHSGLGGVVGSSLSRTASPAAHLPGSSSSGEPVPEDWEDDDV